MQGGYTNPNRKKLAGDLLDDADSREQVSLEDALQLLAKLGKTGTFSGDAQLEHDELLLSWLSGSSSGD